MLTNDELERIKNLIPIWQEVLATSDITINGPVAASVLVKLLNHIDQLTTHNRVMQVALAQFGDGVNWSTAPSVRYVQTGEWPSPLVDQPAYIWRLATNPQQLAERALVGDGVKNG